MTTYSSVSKSPHAWEMSRQSTNAFSFKIDGTNYFLIDSTYKLKIQGGRSVTSWSSVTKSPLTY